MTTILRLVSWNIGLRDAAMGVLKGSAYDVALLQEARLPPDGWEGEHYDRGAFVIRLSDRVELNDLRSIPQGRRPEPDEIAISAPGTIAAARIVPETGKPFLAVSIYARWEKPHPSTPTNLGGRVCRRHGASGDIGPQRVGHIDPSTHRILVAGDFNLIHGATDSNRLALPARDRSVFSRLKALGFEFVGPRYPHGRKANPTPAGLRIDSRNVPTYHTTRQSPATAANQLDYVFASRGFHRSVRVWALNDPAEWGPSDHCRIGIEVDASK